MAEEKRQTVLVVEDEVSVLKALSDKFSREGFIVFGAEDGKKGLKVAMENRPDVILLDLLMPKMGGMEMLAELRKDEGWGKTVPVVILTNLSADDKILGGVVKDQPSFYLLKSDWKIADVVTKVKEALSGASFA